MIVVINRLPVAEAHHEAFEERFRQRAGMVEHAPGFVRFEILRPIKGEYYQVVTYWKDNASFEAWTSSAAFQGGHGQAKPVEGMFTGPNVLEIAEVIQEAGTPLSEG